MVRIDGETQPRQRINEDVVAEYAEALAGGAEFPPVVVFDDGADKWLADGFHRYHAHRKAGRERITADIQQGSREDAQWESYAANANHGLRRTNADIAKIVTLALSHPNAASLSNVQLAEHCGVSEITIRRHREKDKPTSTVSKSTGDFEPETPIQATSTKRTGRDGRTIETANIGKKKAAPPPSAEDQTGRPIPDNCDQSEKIIEAFSRRAVLTGLANQISRVKSEMLALVRDRDPLVAALPVSTFTAEMQSIYHRIKMLAPYAVCAFCGGDGCKACRGRGWVDRPTWEATPAEMRGEK